MNTIDEILMLLREIAAHLQKREQERACANVRFSEWDCTGHTGSGNRPDVAACEEEASPASKEPDKTISLEELAANLDELFKSVDYHRAAKATAAALTRVAIKSSLVATIELHPAVRG